MRKVFTGIALLLPIGLAQAQAPEQAQRGREVFVEKKCGTCHRFDGQGTAIAPDLKAIASLSPRAIAIAIRSTRTQSVISVTLKTGETFFGMRAGAEGDGMQVYDLTKDPPVLRKLTAAEIDSTKDNDAWKHPPATTEMSAQQLADVIGYIRWIGARDKKVVDPAEVQ